MDQIHNSIVVVGTLSIFFILSIFILEQIVCCIVSTEWICIWSL